MRDLSNETMVHIKNKDVQYLQFRKLLEYKNIVQHAYSLKNFDAFNNSTLLNNKDKLMKNYSDLCNSIGINYNKIVRPKQMHTDNIVCVKGEISHIHIVDEEYQHTDGLITDKKDVVLSLTYADCVSIFLFDPIKKVIANIHSGWRGTVKKIGMLAVEKMVKEYECKLENIIACIGPCIGVCHFQVDDDVCCKFKESFSNIGKIDDIIKIGNIVNGKQKYYIDIALANSLILKTSGLKEENIIQSNICTVCNSDLLHSYRVEKSNFGTNTAIMSLL